MTEELLTTVNIYISTQATPLQQILEAP